MTKRRVARFCTTARSFGRDHIFSYRIKRKELRDWKAIGCLLASTLLLGESPDTRQSKHPNQNCRDQRDSDERQQIVTAKIPFDGCPFRKSYPDVVMMQSGQDWNGDNDTGPLDCSMQGRIFL